MSDIYKQFAEPFPKEVERQLKKGGAYLTYIPVSEVITRLNKVVGVGRWNFQINRCERDALDPDFIVAHVTLEAIIENPAGQNVLIKRDGIGGQKIKRTKQDDIVDLGDEMKGAVSDALKKAAQTLGIGLYLARTEEAMEYDVVEETPQVAPKISQLWEQFVSLSKSLSADQRNELNSFWTNWSGGAPKPTKTTATEEQLDALIAQCVALSLNATAVDEDADS